jgi:hypothetical protein
MGLFAVFSISDPATGRIVGARYLNLEMVCRAEYTTDSPTRKLDLTFADGFNLKIVGSEADEVHAALRSTLGRS